MLSSPATLSFLPSATNSLLRAGARVSTTFLPSLGAAGAALFWARSGEILSAGAAACWSCPLLHLGFERGWYLHLVCVDDYQCKCRNTYASHQGMAEFHWSLPRNYLSHSFCCDPQTINEVKSLAAFLLNCIKMSDGLFYGPASNRLPGRGRGIASKCVSQSFHFISHQQTPQAPSGAFLLCAFAMTPLFRQLRESRPLRGGSVPRSEPAAQFPLSANQGSQLRRTAI
jgi:hypothetical protein